MTKLVTEFELKVKTNVIKLNLLRNMIDDDLGCFPCLNPDSITILTNISILFKCIYNVASNNFKHLTFLCRKKKYKFIENINLFNQTLEQTD